MQSSQIRLSEARTFMTSSFARAGNTGPTTCVYENPKRRRVRSASRRYHHDGQTRRSVSVDDAPLVQVVRRHLEGDPVPGEDSDEVHPHLPGHVRQHLVTVIELHPELRVGERLFHGRLDSNRFFFQGPSFNRIEADRPLPIHPNPGQSIRAPVPFNDPGIAYWLAKSPPPPVPEPRPKST